MIKTKMKGIPLGGENNFLDSRIKQGLLSALTTRHDLRMMKASL